MVFYSAVHSGYFFLVSIAILGSVISAAYYLRVVRVVFFDTMPPHPQFTEFAAYATHSRELAPGGWGELTGGKGALPNVTHSMVIASITLLIILFIAKPSPILNTLHLLGLSLFYW
jgi:NADH-ubiquinone oxidoreductase chain 2